MRNKLYYSFIDKSIKAICEPVSCILEFLGSVYVMVSNQKVMVYPNNNNNNILYILCFIIFFSFLDFQK